MAEKIFSSSDKSPATFVWLDWIAWSNCCRAAVVRWSCTQYPSLTTWLLALISVWHGRFFFLAAATFSRLIFAFDFRRGFVVCCFFFNFDATSSSWVIFKPNLFANREPRGRVEVDFDVEGEIFCSDKTLVIRFRTKSVWGEKVSPGTKWKAEEF